MTTAMTVLRYSALSFAWLQITVYCEIKYLVTYNFQWLVDISCSNVNHLATESEKHSFVNENNPVTWLNHDWYRQKQANFILFPSNPSQLIKFKSDMTGRLSNDSTVWTPWLVFIRHAISIARAYKSRIAIFQKNFNAIHSDWLVLFLRPLN